MGRGGDRDDVVRGDGRFSGGEAEGGEKKNKKIGIMTGT